MNNPFRERANASLARGLPPPSTPRAPPPPRELTANGRSRLGSGEAARARAGGGRREMGELGGGARSWRLCSPPLRPKNEWAGAALKFGRI
ncbi:hypothetical protein E2562_028526 [Oryza meyeriana var. granulata]|uniref:Uncharacterized protein n=1 Tax=Oryza meyeriana var. granulata TaxID=110450 RepID=A0A6G1DP99_9ORYZ|nr:hypothetical protein E2562_028526 [Oryza meyeriana var. granulata]